MLQKSQILGIFIFIISFLLAIFWEKTFKYADVFDFVLGIICALSLSMIFKLLPIFAKLDR